MGALKPRMHKVEGPLCLTPDVVVGSIRCFDGSPRRVVGPLALTTARPRLQP
jgi:hypothetical protein